MQLVPPRSARISFALVSVPALLAFAALSRALPPEPKYDVLVPLKPENVSLGHYPFDAAPILTVKTGTTVKINGGGGARWGETDPAVWLKTNNFKESLADLPALTETIAAAKGGRRTAPAPVPAGATPPAGGGGGHMLVGPIAIEGAEPGDSIEIRILDV